MTFPFSRLHPFAYTLTDLTHPTDTNTATWDNGCGFTPTITYDYDINDPVQFRIQNMTMPAGIGTHIDSPSHCIQGGNTVDTIPLDTLIAPLVIIDVSDKADENYRIIPQDVYNFEHENATIPNNAFITFYTGWSKHWNTAQYRNNLQFPSVAKETAELLASKNIVGMGIDTLSPDTGNSGFPVHNIILGANKYIVENMAYLNTMPPIGGYILTLPFKGVHLTESPARVVGLTPKQ